MYKGKVSLFHLVFYVSYDQFPTFIPGTIFLKDCTIVGIIDRAKVDDIAQ